MGSISRLGDVASSIEQSSIQNGPRVPTVSSSVKVAFEDTVALEKAPSPPHLVQLQLSNPTEFHQTVANAVRELKAGASQASDPQVAALLSSLANKLQRLQASGVVIPF